MAQAEKSKFFIFFPDILYGIPRNVVQFFSCNILFNLKENSKNLRCPKCLENTWKKRVSHLLVNFAQFVSHWKKTKSKFRNVILRGLQVIWGQVLDLWINFPGHDKLLKIVKIRLAKILSFVTRWSKKSLETWRSVKKKGRTKTRYNFFYRAFYQLRMRAL